MKIAVNARNGSWDFECAAGEKILHAALRSGVELPYECATGTCGTCKATLVSGRHESHWPDAPGHRHLKSPAEILTCQSVAHEDCQLELGVLKPGEADMAAPRPLGGVIETYRRLTHDVVAFDLRLDEPLEFEAGQFALLPVPGIAGARAYSMVNFDRRAECLSFVVKKKPDGAVSDGGTSSSDSATVTDSRAQCRARSASSSSRKKQSRSVRTPKKTCPSQAEKCSSWPARERIDIMPAMPLPPAMQRRCLPRPGRNVA